MFGNARKDWVFDFSDIGEAIFALVLSRRSPVWVNRILDPCSKRRAELWLEEVYEPGFSFLKLQHFYRCLDFLDERKVEIEEELFSQVEDLFNLELDIVFYDTTSVYFEEKGPEDLAPKGYSNLIGVLMTKDGTPIGCEVFPGNCYDGTTLKCVLETLSRRFHLKRVIFVGDRAMVSQENLSHLEELGYEYILGVKMGQLKDVNKAVSSVNESLWVKEVKVGRSASRRTPVWALCFMFQSGGG